MKFSESHIYNEANKIENELSLYDVQCKLNNAGASGIFSGFFRKFILFLNFRKIMVYLDILS